MVSGSSRPRSGRLRGDDDADVRLAQMDDVSRIEGHRAIARAAQPLRRRLRPAQLLGQALQRAPAALGAALPLVEVPAGLDEGKCPVADRGLEMARLVLGRGERHRRLVVVVVRRPLGEQSRVRGYGVLPLDDGVAPGEADVRGEIVLEDAGSPRAHVS